MRLHVDKLGKVSITVEKDPWDMNKTYNRLTIVGTNDGIAYISRCLVPRGIPTDNRNYWIPIGVTSAPIQANSYKLLDAEYELPTTEDAYEGPYLIDNYAYFWVGTGGNVEDKPEYKKIEIAGKDGKSAYTSYAEYVISIGGELLSESEWSAQFAKLAVLALVQKITINDTPNYPDEEGNINIEIHDGKSAYELAVESGDPNATTIMDWLNSLKGKSAYEIAKEEDPSIENITAWLESLKGKKGNDGAKGDRGPKGDSIIDADVEALLVNNLLEGGESSMLTAEMGRQLSLNVIDVISDNSAFVAPTTQEEVGDYGILWFNTTNNTFYYYYWNVNTEEQNVNPPSFQSGSQGVEQENPTQAGEEYQVESVQYVTFLPNPHMLYCDKENEKVVRWDIESEEFVEVASAGGGGLTARIEGDTLVLKHNAIVPTNPTIIKFIQDDLTFRCEQNETFELTATIRALNPIDDLILQLEGTNSSNFDVTPSTIELSNIEKNNTITISYSPGDAEVNVSHKAYIKLLSNGIEYGVLELTGFVIAGPTVIVTEEEIQINKEESDYPLDYVLHLAGYALTEDVELTLDENSGFSFDTNPSYSRTIDNEDLMSSAGVDVRIYYIEDEDSTGTLTIASNEIESIVIPITGSIVSRKTTGTIFTDPVTGCVYKVREDTQKVLLSSNDNATTSAAAYNHPGQGINNNGIITVPTEAVDENGITYRVEGTDKRVFYSCSTIKAIILGDHITHLYTSSSTGPMYAASRDRNLKYLKIGNGVSNIPKQVLWSGISGFKILDLGTGISSLTNNQFPELRGIESIVLRNPTSVVTVNANTFRKEGTQNTPKPSGDVKVYVPDTLLAQYRSTTNSWAAIGFTSTDFYPLSEYVEPDLNNL